MPAGGGGADKGPWVGPGHSRVLFSEARFKSPMLSVFPDELLGETFLSLVPVLEEGMGL